MIRQNKNIYGISMGEIENNFLQYADDTEIMLEGDKNLSEETIQNINIWRKKSGLFLNTKKNSAI